MTFAADIASHLTRLTGDTWTGTHREGNEACSFKLRRDRDALTLDASAGFRGGMVQDPWNVSLNLYRGGVYDGGRSWLGYHLPYFSDKARAEEAGKPWGRIADVNNNRSINIGQGKTAEQAAKDIAKRLLPRVEPAWECVCSVDADCTNYHKRSAALADHLAVLLGTTARYDLERATHTVTHDALGLSLTTTPDRVRMHLRLTPAQAEAVIVALKAVTA